MKEVIIYEYQLKEIIDALRLSANINGCWTKESAYARTLMLAYQYANNAIEGQKDKKPKR